MLGGTNYKGTQYCGYSRSTPANSDPFTGPRQAINRLTAFLTDSTVGSPADKALAAEILEWVSSKEQSGEDFWIDCYVNLLWESPEHFGIRDVVGKEGTTRECVCLVDVNVLHRLASTPKVTA
jgi:hypothetical protein